MTNPVEDRERLTDDEKAYLVNGVFTVPLREYIKHLRRYPKNLVTTLSTVALVRNRGIYKPRKTSTTSAMPQKVMEKHPESDKIQKIAIPSLAGLLPDKFELNEFFSWCVSKGLMLYIKEKMEEKQQLKTGTT